VLRCIQLVLLSSCPPSTVSDAADTKFYMVIWQMARPLTRWNGCWLSSWGCASWVLPRWMLGGLCQRGGSYRGHAYLSSSLPSAPLSSWVSSTIPSGSSALPVTSTSNRSLPAHLYPAVRLYRHLSTSAARSRHPLLPILGL